MRSASTLMVQGTTSDAGKSVFVAALCRILMRHGIQVAPFKPQNMALNSAVTAEGGEIGRAQAVQAMAAGIAPHVDMNPVLLKPNNNTGAQVIVLGKAIGDLEAWGFNEKKPRLFPSVLAAHERLSNAYQAVIVEGAGSPAEINLRKGDIANMGFAEEVDCPVIIIADIDRGGVYAHLLGTFECLSESEKSRVKGFIINKFRGDQSLLKPANDWLLEKTGVPILAVIPFIPDLYIEAEDAINMEQKLQGDSQVNIAVVTYPRISNHTDFDVLRLHPQVNLSFVRSMDDIHSCDLLILPGSKNVQADLAWLTEKGWPNALTKHLRYGGKVMGICGGLQMLGTTISDPHGIEGDKGSKSNGLGWLELNTELASEKTLRNVNGVCTTTGVTVSGYEIHAGQTTGEALSRPLFNLNHAGSSYHEGARSEDDQIRGTYLHGVFDDTDYLQNVLSWAGLERSQAFNLAAYQQSQLDYLAAEVEKAWPVDEIIKLLTVRERPQLSNHT